MQSAGRKTKDGSYTSIHPSLDMVDDFRQLAANVPPVAADDGDTLPASDATPSNPDQWREKRSRKMHDLQLHYSCDPLRVVQTATDVQHVEHLHATLNTVLPQPHGLVKEFRQTVPHTSDEVIAQQARKLMHGTVDAKAAASLASLPGSSLPAVAAATRMTPATPGSAAEASRKVLESQTGMRATRGDGSFLPHRGVLRPPPSTLVVREDSDSVFSVTTTGMRTSTGAPAAVASNPSSRSSTAQMQQPVFGGAAATGGSTVSKVSKASSGKSSQRAAAVEQQLDEERRSNSSIADHLKEAAAQLDRLEQLLARREQAFTHN